MRHAYLVLCHSNFCQIQSLINMIQENNDVYVHVDLKYDLVYEHLKNKYSNSTNVFILDNRIKTYWSHYSCVKATLMLMEEALKNKYDYLSLISGTCFPIKKDGDFKKMLSQNYGKEFISSCLIENLANEDFRNPYFRKIHMSRFFNVSGRKDNKFIQLLLNTLEVIIFLGGFKKNSKLIHYFKDKEVIYGSQWFTLTTDAVHFLLKEFSNEFLEMWKFTTNSEELCFHSVLYNSIFKKRIVCHNLRFIHWGPTHNAPPEEINLDLLEKALSSSNYIARKFNFEKYPEVKERVLASLDSPAQ
jgi:glycerol-3-phosphate responsive antiterminator